MLAIAQIVVSLVLIALIIVQERSSGTGGLFGSGGGDSSFQTRRGVEKFVYYGTIGAAALFAILAVLSLTTPR
ncbi:MAG: preprotein translocase subunit SecG [Candidatus Paceibacterota bacterium]|jgi:protein translocase SecG subunit